MEQLGSYINLLSAILVFIGLIYTARQLQATKQIHSENHEWNRRLKSLSFSFSDKPEYIDILKRLDEHFKINSKKPEKISYDYIVKLSQEEYKEVFNDIHFVLARLESMCIAIENNIADEDVCRYLLRTRVITLNKIFTPYIDNAKHNRGSDDMFSHLQHYAKEWKNCKINGKEALGKLK